MEPAAIRFSIIIPTRDRPELCARAIDSVLAQSWAGTEVIVIDDGSAGPHAAAYRGMAEAYGGRVRFHMLPRQPQGFGHPLTRNIAVSLSSGGYVGFLDDDDIWTDPGFLSRAAAVLGAHRADLYLADQEAVSEGRTLPPGVWIEALAGHTAEFRAAGADAFALTPAELFRHTEGFCHPNTMLMARPLFDAIGGFHAGLRYEPDREIFLRALDRADGILYCPRVVARHFVPDQTKTANASTKTTPLEKALIQLLSFEKAVLNGRGEVRAFALRHKVFTLKKVAELLHRAGDHRGAFGYAREALGLAPSAKWGAFVLWLGARALLRPGTGYHGR